MMAASHGDAILPSHEGEVAAELEQEVLEVMKQSALQVGSVWRTSEGRSRDSPDGVWRGAKPGQVSAVKLRFLFFRLAAEGETDRFVPFVLSTCRDEGSVVEMSVRENLVVVRLGGAGGVTAADLSAAQALSESRWAHAVGVMAA